MSVIVVVPGSIILIFLNGKREREREINSEKES